MRVCSCTCVSLVPVLPLFCAKLFAVIFVRSVRAATLRVRAERGYAIKVVMPDDVAIEKAEVLTRLGAEVIRVKPAAISSDANCAFRCSSSCVLVATCLRTHADANVARRLAASTQGGWYVDQFENPANARVHEASTGPEIWADTAGGVDAFVMGAGTGGTISGVARALKARSRAVRVYLADPPGSALYSRVVHGVAFAPEQAERRLRRHR